MTIISKLSTQGRYGTGVGLHRPCRITDTPGDREAETAKVRKGEFIMGPRPLFITSRRETERITGLTGTVRECNYASSIEFRV